MNFYIFCQNERHTSLIKKSLKTVLSKKEWKKANFITTLKNFSCEDTLYFFDLEQEQNIPYLEKICFKQQKATIIGLSFQPYISMMLAKRHITNHHFGAIILKNSDYFSTLTKYLFQLVRNYSTVIHLNQSEVSLMIPLQEVIAILYGQDYDLISAKSGTGEFYQIKIVHRLKLIKEQNPYLEFIGDKLLIISRHIPKIAAYSLDKRNDILKKRKEGKSVKQLHQQYQVGCSTIYHWEKEENYQGKIVELQRKLSQHHSKLKKYQQIETIILRKEEQEE